MSLPIPRRINYQIGSQQEACTGCGPGLERVAVECLEPHCAPAKELTAQCTDQCVIIACSDPNHAESICGGGGIHTHCDLDCDETIDCTDCHGFDAFLKCCDDYRPCGVQTTLPPSQSTDRNLSFDETFQQFWCECMCGQSSGTTDQSQIAPKHTLDYQNLPTSPETNNNGFNHSMDATESSSFSIGNPSQLSNHCSASETTSPALCMWDACHDSFSSISELVGHVGTHLSHVVTPTQGMHTDSFQTAIPSDSYSLPVSCLWENCNGSSQFTSPDDLELLATHLMYEHLGISPECPQYQLPLPEIAKPVIQALTGVNHSSGSLTEDFVEINKSPSGSKSPSPVVQQHSCADTHECKWTGCGQKFYSCDELTAHINSSHIGSGKAHYECFWDQCTRNGAQGFQSKQKICRHIQSHTGHRPFLCTICHQNFSEAATLQQHIRRHTQEKPYVCDYPGCGKSFAITGALTIHKRTHNGDKPFKCTFCDRGFAESSNLSKHLRTHTGARPYTCTEPGCNKAFARPDQLNRHKGVHRKQVRGVARITLE